MKNNIYNNQEMSVLCTHLTVMYMNIDISQNSTETNIDQELALAKEIEEYQQNPPTVRFIEVDDSNKQHPVYDAIEEHVSKTLSVVTFKNVSYIYDWDLMKYRPDNNDIEKFILNLLKSENYSRKKGIQGLVAEIVYRIKKSTSVSEYPFNHCKGFIPVRNGILDVKSRRLFDHSPAFGFTYCISPSYNQKANPSAILNYLKSLTHEDSADLLIQMISQALIHEPMKKAYLLYNKSGNNGKSTFLEFLTAFFGPQNVSHISLQDICKGGFRLAQIDGKIANIYADLPREYIPDIGLFKTLTGDDTITIERKYQDPYPLKNRAILIFGCNELPEVNDRSKPFFERLYLIEFPNQFKVRANFLEELITEENLSALLNLGLDRIDILLDQGLIKDKGADETREEWQLQSDNCYRFISANLESDNEISEDNESVTIYKYILPFEETYQGYLTECGLTNENPESKRKFREKLIENGFSTRRIGSRGEQTEYIVAVRFKKPTPLPQHDIIAVSQKFGEISGN